MMHKTSPRRAFLAGLGLSIAAAPAIFAQSAVDKLKAGAARTKVTPPLAIPYLTSSGAGTNTPFQGVHDDLFARALVLDDGREPIALLAVDSIGYDNALLGPNRNFTAELRQRVAAKTGIKPQAIMLAASHTHSAPETLTISPFRDAPGASQWIEQHLDQLAETVISAWQRRTPARFRAGSIEAPGLARYRRIQLKAGGESRRGPVPPPADVAAPWQLDEALNVLYVETTDGRPLSAVLNYTAHPVVAMLLPQVSADFPGAATALVERELPGSICLFTQGCAGNINSIDVSTSFADVEAIGGRLGHFALECIGRLKESPPLTDTRLAALSKTIQLAPRSSMPFSEARRLADAKPTAANKRLLRMVAKLDEGPIEAEVQAMAVGSVRWVSLPGEPFVETGLALKRAGATFVVGYANGYVGYLPIRRAYAEGGYEVDMGAWSRVAPGSAERLQAIGEELLQKLGAARATKSAAADASR